MDVQKGFLAGISALLIFISFLMAAPFLGYLLTAIIIAFILNPAQQKLEPYLGQNLSSGLVIVLFIAAIFAPFVLGLNAVIGDATEIANNIDGLETIDFTEIEQMVKEYTDQEIDFEAEIRELLRDFASIAVGGFSQILNMITGLAIGVLITLFAIFYLLRDGDKLYTWLRKVTPMEKDLQDHLYSKASLMTWSVLKGHVLVAILTGLIGGLGLFIAGVPRVAFWTFIMILLCFIPLIGAFMVWAPASAYLFIADRPLAGAFLFLYGLIVVSLADNILRPYLVDKRADIHPAAILLGVIGGVYVFGAVGLFIGPVVFGFTKTALEVLMKNYESL
jgi:predicted PurR-regulated permease PerM